MALIECLECGNQVSDRANACPHCGFPINQISSNKIECPNCGMSIDMDCEECPICGFLIKQIVGISPQQEHSSEKEPVSQNYVEVPRQEKEVKGNAISRLDINGSVKIWSYEDGIKIGENKNISIHKSQITKVYYERTSEKIDVETNKSVIKRAAVGGLVMGPVGAIVGGMSGIGTKHTTEIVHKYRLIIEYIDDATDTPSQIVSECDVLAPVNEFINKYGHK